MAASVMNEKLMPLQVNKILNFFAFLYEKGYDYSLVNCHRSIKILLDNMLDLAFNERYM